MNILQHAARRPESLETLDKVARPLARTVGRAVRPRVVRNLPSGAGLGHPLPMLTDLPIGAWVMSALLHAAGGPAAEGPPTFWSPSAWWPPRRPWLPGCRRSPLRR